MSTAQLEVPAPPAVDDRGVPAGAWVVDCVLDRPAALSQRGAMPASIRVADGIEVLFDGELFDLDQLAAKWHVSQAVASDPASIALEAYRRLGRDCVDEGGEIVLRLALELGHALRRRRLRALPDLGYRVRRDGAQLGPGLEGGELDVQPARELALLRPDPGHLGSGVARDHRSQSRARGGRR